MPVKQPKPKPRPVGRPKLESGHKNAITPVRLSEADRAKVENAAAKSGLKISEWIRQTLQNAL